MKPLYHYTAYLCLPMIRHAGAIKPRGQSTGGMLWFSTADQWEPMAGKCLDARHGLRRLTFEEQSEKLGCARFVLDNAGREMLDWEGIISRAGLNKTLRESLEAEAQTLGANPRHWYATTDSIPLNTLRFEVWESGRWRGGNIESIADQLLPMVPREWRP